MNHPAPSHPRSTLRWAAAAALAALAGCNVIPPAQEDATRYFLLSAGAGAGAERAPAAGGLRIGLHPVVLESYLDHRTMVLRTGPNEIRFEDYRRWAEPLQAGVARVLRSAFLASPDVAQVFVEPFPLDQDRDFDVVVKVLRCEGAAAPEGRHAASFEATIEVTAPGAAPHTVALKSFAAPDAAWDGADYARLAALLSRDVDALAKAVLAALPPKG